MHEFSDEPEKRKTTTKRIQEVLAGLHTVAIVALVIAITVVSVYIETRLKRLENDEDSQEVNQEEIQKALAQQVHEKLDRLSLTQQEEAVRNEQRRSRLSLAIGQLEDRIRQIEVNISEQLDWTDLRQTKNSQ
jgi:hypothetical protein